MSSAIPQNPEAEQAIIGALLLGQSTVPVTEDHFAAPDNRLVFAACRDLAELGEPVDVQTVAARLRARGELDNAGGPPARFLPFAAGGEVSALHHFAYLEEARQARAVALYARANLPELCAMRLPAPRFVEELNEIAAPKAASLYLSCSDIISELEAENAAGAEAFGFGLPELDRHLRGGIMRGELGVVAADTGRGKTALMVQAVAEAAKAGIPSLFVTLEMPATEIFKRAVSAATGTPQSAAAFRAKALEAEEWPLKVSGQAVELHAIGAMVRAAARRDKVALVAVDYLQIVESPGDNREGKVSEAARYLKALASSENVAILTASQVNEDGRLRESRAIGHHANFVLTVEDGEIECQKFRRGPWQWSIPARLRGELSRFVAEHR